VFHQLTWSYRHKYYASFSHIVDPSRFHYSPGLISSECFTSTLTAWIGLLRYVFGWGSGDLHSSGDLCGIIVDVTDGVSSCLMDFAINQELVTRPLGFQLFVAGVIVEWGQLFFYGLPVIAVAGRLSCSRSPLSYWCEPRWLFLCH